MTKCPFCNNNNPLRYSYCLACGRRLPFFARWHKPILMLCLATVGFLLFIMPEPEKQIAKVNDGKPQETTPTPAPEKELPPEVEAIHRSEVTMPDGSTGVFDIYVLDKQYVWKTGSETIVEGLGDLSVKDQWKSAVSEPLIEQIKKAPEIIVVGTADVRSGADGGQREISRAGARSRTLLSVVTDIRSSGQAAFTLNLGQWIGSKNVALEDQRRVIFIAVEMRSDRLDLKDGVREALKMKQAKEPIFKEMLASYSKSDDLDIR